MKNKIFLIIVFLFSVVSLKANTVDSLLVVLDKAILDSHKYVEVREKRIKELKKFGSNLSNARKKYANNMLLYKEYRTFICDSAISYLNKNIVIAESLKDKSWINESKLLLCSLHSSSGMYKESSDVLYSIDKKQLSKSQTIDYYRCYEHLYNEMYLYSHDKKLIQEYYRLFISYRDSLLIVCDPSSDVSLGIREQIALEKKRYKEARSLNNQRLAKAKVGNPIFALISFEASLIDREEHKVKEEKKHLILSALSDIQMAIKDNASLSNLANLLYSEGDIDRAYKYIKYSLEDANFYNARLRNIQVSNTLPIIERSYQIKSDKQKRQLTISLLSISGLAILLFCTLFYIYLQMKKLAKARKDLGVINKKLKDLNSELSEANLIKEEYIAHFLSICSLYIDKMDNYRKVINKKITLGQISELVKISKSSDIIDNELKDFYMNFDNTFLHLYPRFVHDFNNLLNEDERIILKKGESLNTELRIFALIRLGIDDSSKIANLLRYSVNTIYNYRAKVKNKALGNRDNFELEVKKIGSIS